jgi:hypothetical protein
MAARARPQRRPTNKLILRYAVFLRRIPPADIVVVRVEGDRSWSKRYAHRFEAMCVMPSSRGPLLL